MKAEEGIAHWTLERMRKGWSIVVDVRGWAVLHDRHRIRTVVQRAVFERLVANGWIREAAESGRYQITAAGAAVRPHALGAFNPGDRVRATGAGVSGDIESYCRLHAAGTVTSVTAHRVTVQWDGGGKKIYKPRGLALLEVPDTMP
jgi:hypothetical protein